MKDKILLSASLLATDLSQVTHTLNLLDSVVDMIHFDVMDGKFTPNITFGSKFISDLRSKSHKMFDTHLMIENPEVHLQSFLQTGSDIITLHYESCKDLNQAFTIIKESGKKIGLAINPSTSLNSIIHLLPQIDSLLIMTVNPGFCGQKFLSDQLEKISNAKMIINQKNLNCLIQVDGGINATSAAQAIKAGANCLVSGSFILGPQGLNYQNINELKNLLNPLLS